MQETMSSRRKNQLKLGSGVKDRVVKLVLVLAISS
jgi:hypothetical protein